MKHTHANVVQQLNLWHAVKLYGYSCEITLDSRTWKIII